MDNYRSMLDHLEEEPAMDFFNSTISSDIEDSRLADLFLKAEQAMWNLMDYLEMKEEE